MGGHLDSSSTLARARSANRRGSRMPHTVVVLPSYSVGDSLLAHYAGRLPILEHRYLLWLLMLPHVPASQIVFVTSVRPSRKVLDYYLSLVPPEHRRDMRARMRILVVPDSSARSITTKLLDRPDLVERLRRMLVGRLAYIEPWNVTPAETELACRLGVPLNGTAAELWPLGFKSNGRKLMRSAGVPLPLGHEDVDSVDAVVAAAAAVKRQHPGAAGVVIKTDNSGTGDGNRVIRFSHNHTARDIRTAVEALEPWYLADLALGAVVEEFLVGRDFACPSVQVDITPEGSVEVLSTHEQLVGGPNGQVYVGCQFPANGSYGHRLAAYGEAVGRVLAGKGALGRFCVDFAAVESLSGSWDIYGLEINLRKSGTTHPIFALSSLAPGRYDGETGRWFTEDGSERCYRSTDSLEDPTWVGRAADDVISAIRMAGLEFDREARTGVVLHALCGLDIDGRLGLTAIGTSTPHAEHLYEAAVSALSVSSPATGATRAGVPAPRRPVDRGNSVVGLPA
jgi:hypothetical protein